MRNHRIHRIVFGLPLPKGGPSNNGHDAAGRQAHGHSQRALGRLAAVMFAGTIFFSQNTWAVQECVAILQVVGVSRAQMAATAENGSDENSDGEIWIQTGPTTMQGFINCSNIPGSRHGDMYQQNSVTGKTRRTGSDIHGADAAKTGRAETPLEPLHTTVPKRPKPPKKRPPTAVAQ